jgi:hypothetical protein
MELFDLPPQRLDAETHAAVFGELPSALAASLHTAEVGDLVLQLLDKGWRRGQLAARIGALPAGRDPEADIHALVVGFLEQVPPDARWREEKAQRDRDRAAARSSAQVEEPASEQSRAAWIERIRTDLGTPRSSQPKPVRRVRPPCALCEAESSFFVTKEVRLCDGCVVLLSTGAVRLSEAG